MKLYLISQNVNDNYDTYDSAIVCAESSYEARRTHPGDKSFIKYKFQKGSWLERFSNESEWKQSLYHGWVLPKYVKVKEIGIANKSIKKGVICASFNAG